MTPTPPHDERAEAAILGAVLMDNEAFRLVGPMLDAEHFYIQKHREVYAAMAALAEDQSPIDIVTLSERLTSAGRMKSAGGMTYLVKLSNDTPMAANVAQYVKIVRDKAMSRAVISAAQATVSEGMGDPADATRYLEGLSPHGSNESKRG